MLIDACTDVLMLIRMDKSHQVCAISFEWLCRCVIVGVHAKNMGDGGGEVWQRFRNMRTGPELSLPLLVGGTT